MDLKTFKEMRERKGQLLIKDWEIYPGKIIKAGTYIDVLQVKANELIAGGYLENKFTPKITEKPKKDTEKTSENIEKEAKQSETKELKTKNLITKKI